ncbi:OLC1v1026837C1 [Oldenlandia corymbosa var. corymbosa]|uniref:OLC1v1026837C1 n=1 Tax=Oldenlandia corymbosa var. corymbosa TaxID=529605 RepID=A0AAV1C9R6_OLDCO|nr:OLC1v1026837C1 [Oldenlandia corymbosa var. corymbosa]
MSHVQTRQLINYNNLETFEIFYQSWLIRQEQYLQELVQALQCYSNDDEENEVKHKELIAKVMDHYAEYSAAKGKIAQENVFLLFKASWLTSYERVYLWIGGFRPVLACKILSSLSDLTEDQSKRISSLTAQTKKEETELSNLLSRVQESVVDPRIVALATHLGQLRNGANADTESATEKLRISMEALLECGDYVREKTVMEILEILSTPQALGFLAAAAQFQLTVRGYGLRTDANRPSF